MPRSSMPAAFCRKIEKAHANPLPGDPLAKSTFSQSGSPTSGLTYYDLETGAKFVYPLLTPLRNEIPRVSGKGGIQANWRAVTGINTTGLRIGVSGGNRGGVQAVTTQDYSAAYKGIGIETSVDFEAQYAGMGFDDIKAIGAKIGLEACMLGEELLILGGNTSVPLGTTPTPSLAPSTSGGTLTAAASPYQRDLRGARARCRGQRQRHRRHPRRDHAQQCRRLVRHVRRRRRGQIRQRHRVDCVGHRRARSRRPLRRSPARSVTLGSGAPPAPRCWALSPPSIRWSSPPMPAGAQTAASLGAQRQFDQCAGVRRLALSGVQVRARTPMCDISPTGTAGTGATLTGDGSGGIVEIDAALKIPLGQLPAVARYHVGVVAGRQ